VARYVPVPYPLSPRQLRGIALNDPVTGSLTPRSIHRGQPLSGPLPHHMVTDVSLLTSRTLVRCPHPAEYHPRDDPTQSPSVINSSIDPLPSVFNLRNFFIAMSLAAAASTIGQCTSCALVRVVFYLVSSSRVCALPPLARRHHRRRSAGAVAIAFLEASQRRGCALPPLVCDLLPSSTVRCPPPRHV
jgi:hypothetical protein